MYLRSFFSKRNYLQARRVNALTASALLQRDRLNITQFFSSEYVDELKQTGLRTIDDIHQRFEILRAMSNVLKAGSNAHDVLDDIKLIVDDLGLRHGKRAIVILAKKNGNRKNALNQWKCAVHCSLGNTVPDFHGDEKTYQNIFRRR